MTPIDIPACVPRQNGRATMPEAKFLGKARAQLLGVGLVRPAEDAIHVNMYLSQVGSPPFNLALPQACHVQIDSKSSMGLGCGLRDKLLEGSWTQGQQRQSQPLRCSGLHLVCQPCRGPQG